MARTCKTAEGHPVRDSTVALLQVRAKDNEERDLWLKLALRTAGLIMVRQLCGVTVKLVPAATRASPTKTDSKRVTGYTSNAVCWLFN